MIVDKALRVCLWGSRDYHVMLKYDNITVASYILERE